MEFSLATNNELVIPEVVSLENELQSISKEVFISRAAQEFSLYRLCRILETKLWKEKFSYQEFCSYIEDTYNISIMTVMSRLRTYRALTWSGYSVEESLKMMIDRPYLYTRAVQNLLLFNDASGEPVLKIATESKEEAVNTVRNIIESVQEMKVSDAEKYIKENYTLEPVIIVRIEESSILVDYTLYAPNETGEVEIIDYGKILFHPNKEVPEKVLDEIKRRIGANR